MALHGSHSPHKPIDRLAAKSWLHCRCGDPRGCCGYYAGCMDLASSPLQPFQSCWRKFQLNLTAANHYPSPGVYYTPGDVASKWQPGSPGGAFTSGMHAQQRPHGLHPDLCCIPAAAQWLSSSVRVSSCLHGWGCWCCAGHVLSKPMCNSLEVCHYQRQA